MYRYSKGEGKGVWKLIENKPEAIAKAAQTGAHFITVLSLDQDLAYLEEDTKVYYKGPLYFDIDAADENDSLADCRSLLLRLYTDYGVRLKDLTIHCTGGKGFHILIPPRIFSSGKAQQYLAYTYKNMALSFDLAYLDYGIYSCGKGRMWRIENIARASGRYKVALTAAEIFGCTFEEIYERTLEPGEPTLSLDDKRASPVEFSAELSALFRRSAYKFKKIATVADELLQKFPGNLPCIKQLLAGEDILDGRRFNHITLLLAAYAKGKGWDIDTLIEEADTLIEDYPSSVYKTRREKIQHIKSIFNYVCSSSQYSFSCSSARLNIDCQLTLCPTCSLGEEVAERDYDTTLGLEAMHNCYYRKTDSGRIQLSTFVIVPTSVVEFIDVLNTSEYTINTELVADNKHKASVVFTQPDWAGKSALIKRLPHPDFAYFGGDVEVQKLFKLVAQVEVPHKTGVKVIGLHKVKGKWHFASKEGSLGPDGEEDEILLESDYYLPMSILSTPMPTHIDIISVLTNLFKFNAPHIATPLVGWFVASFFKERIFEHTRQFPLLFIFGAAGAGKTQTILNLKRLFSLKMDNIKSIADITGFTLIKAANSNNTVPLMLDEYKSSTFSPYQVKMVSKLIRAAYNNEVGERGTASQKINTYFYRAPIILAGEQTITEPAARDRIIEVHMNKVTSAPYLSSFTALQTAPLEKLGKLLLTRALTISDEGIKQVLADSEKLVPAEFTDRPRLNQTIVMAGLQLLHAAVKEYDYEGIVETAIENYTEDSLIYSEEDRKESKKTDIDQVFEGIDLMIDADDRYQISPGFEFELDGDELFLNMRVIYMKFVKFAKEYTIGIDPMNFTSMVKLLKKEPYYVKDSVLHNFKSSGRRLSVILSKSVLLEKGLSMPNILNMTGSEQKSDPAAFSVKDN